MRCSCRILSKLKPLLFHMLILSGAKSIRFESVSSTTFWKTNNALAYRSQTCRISLRVSFQRKMSGEISKPNQDNLTGFPPPATAGEWKLGLSCVHDSWLNLSTQKKKPFHLLSNTYNSPKFAWTFPLCLSAVSHIIQRLVLCQLSLGFQAQLPRFRGHIGSGLDDESLAKGLAPMWVISCGWIICMWKPAGFGFKR